MPTKLLRRKNAVGQQACGAGRFVAVLGLRGSRLAFAGRIFDNLGGSVAGFEGRDPCETKVRPC